MKLPPGWSLTTIEPNPSPPLPDLCAAVESALAQPLSSPCLIDLASPATRVCIVFTDATRACPDHILVPAVLGELDRAGVPDDYITLLCATGLHRPSTRAEKIAKLGREVVERYRVIDHDPSAAVIPRRVAPRNLDPSARVVDRNEIPRPFGARNDTARNDMAVNALLLDDCVTPHLPVGAGVPNGVRNLVPPARVDDRAEIPRPFGARNDTARNDMAVNALLLDSDLIVATGVVEPHQYAGYSGGGKTVVIGCGSEATIGLTHGPQFLDHPGVRLGQIEGNPFQHFVRDAAQAIGLKFVVNVVLDGEGRAMAVQAGDPIAVHDALVAAARSVYEVPLEQAYDVVIAQVDPPKDVNLYQASRAATYIGLSAAPPLRPGGVIIVAAQCPEGAGQGRGEERFFTALSQASDSRQLLAQYRRDGCRAGEQRAYMLARVLLNYEVVVAGSRCPEIVEACHLIAAASLDEAIEHARRRLGATAHVLYLPHPLQTIPGITHRT